MNQKRYTEREMESAIEIAHTAGVYGYRTPNSRDAMSGFIEWAIEFEKMPYAADERLEIIGDFVDAKMREELRTGRADILDKVVKSRLLGVKGRGPTVDGSRDFWHRMTETERQEWIERDIAEAAQYDMAYELTKGWQKYASIIEEMAISAQILDIPVPVIKLQDLDEGIAAHAALKAAGEKLLDMHGKGELIFLDREELSLAGDPALTKMRPADGIKVLLQKAAARTVESFRRAEITSRQMCDEYVVANEKSGRYVGKVIGESELHIVQDAGRRTGVIHEKGKLDKVSMVGQRLSINYSNGRGAVVDRSFGCGLGR